MRTERPKLEAAVTCRATMKLAAKKSDTSIKDLQNKKLDENNISGGGGA